MDYKILPNGNLLITIDDEDKQILRQAIADKIEEGESTVDLETEFLEPLICNSELSWISPSDMEAMIADTAPCLGIWNGGDKDGDDETLSCGWAYMDYAVLLLHETLLNEGKAIFTLGYGSPTT